MGSRKRRDSRNGYTVPPGVAEVDVLRGELDKARIVVGKQDAMIKALDGKCSMVSQILATLLHREGLDGVTFTEPDRIACGDACGFRVSLKPLEDGGGIQLTLQAFTEEERLELDKARKEHRKGGSDGPGLILPPGLRDEGGA